MTRLFTIVMTAGRESLARSSSSTLTPNASSSSGVRFPWKYQISYWSPLSVYVPLGSGCWTSFVALLGPSRRHASIWKSM
jgi:hypothetical protein